MHNTASNNPLKLKSHRVALFERGTDRFVPAIVAVSITDEHNAIGIDDPTCKPHSRRYLSYETEAEANRFFAEIICSSVKHGCRLIYNGPRLLG